MNSLVRTLALGAALVCLVACGKPFVAATPAGFVDLGDKYEANEYRATTADGVILRARAFENDLKIPLDFWSTTIERRMREMGGYALLERRNVSARGMNGVLFQFGHDEGKEPYLYDLAVFVGHDKVFVLEAGGPKAEVAKQKAQIDAFVQGFRAK